MIKNTFGESLIGVVIGVFILSFIILGIANLLINSKTMIDIYENKKIINILKQNTENIINRIDISHIQEDEIFYLYKNSSTSNFESLTGSINEEYKYIDQYGNKIDDIQNFEGNIYTRTLWLERDDISIGDNHQKIEINIEKLNP